MSKNIDSGFLQPSAFSHNNVMPELTTYGELAGAVWHLYKLGQWFLLGDVKLPND